jgi:hypothetical protein
MSELFPFAVGGGPQGEAAHNAADAAPAGPLRPAYPTFHRLAAAQAVLAPLCGLDAVTFPPGLDTVRAVQALWRSRLAALRAAGWRPAREPFDLAYLANCPPHSFALDGTGRKPCNKYRACPFCHGLRVSLLYENLLRAVRRQPPLDLHLLVSERHCPAADLPACLDELRRGAEGLLHDAGEPSGALTRVAVSPARNEPGRVLARHALLLALPAGGVPSAGVAGRGYPVARDDLSLALTAANLGRYAPGLLYGPAGDAAGLLASVAGLHLGGAQGVFRSARSAVAIEQCRDQRPAPASRPALPYYRLAEEEVPVSHLAAQDYPHERLAVRSLLARLGLPARGSAFASAGALPMPMAWAGPLDLTMEEFFRPPRRLRDAFGAHRRPGEHALVFLAPGWGYVAFSTLALGRAPLAEDFAVFEQKVQGRRYVFEALGQLAERLRTLGSGPAGQTPAPLAG